ncbi:MAG: glycosyl hydrolase [Acidobacteriota bacterium]
MRQTANRRMVGCAEQELRNRAGVRVWKGSRWAALGLAIMLCLPSLAAARKGDKKGGDEPAEETSRLVAGTFSGLQLRSIGPALMSGRIADIAVHPHDQSTWYVAVGSGNVWKTTNAGTTWKTIFEDQGSYSIGCITLDPQQPEIVWLGTGENVGGRHVGYGDGVYKSLDGGESWEKVGLEASEHIGNIVVDPRDSNVVYVAAQGPLWSAGGDRGLFKTTDGGATWEKLLGDDEYTGVNEVRMDPRDPDVLYASTHQRLRTVAALINGGPGSGIHKSVDGGETWRELTHGLPKADMGKIGLAISPQNPDVVYATVELANREGGFFRSENGGGTWEKRSDYVSGGTGPHYYQEIFASPHKFDRVYQMDPRQHVTEDGGKTFVPVGEQDKHGDNHALAFDPNDPNYLLSGSDGGIYESWDLGKTWKFITNLPVTQFYKVAVDTDEPFYNLYGGTQDNNTQGGPSRTMNVNGIMSSDWFITLFADGHQPATDPSNPDIVYSEWQQGNLVRYDRKTGEIVYIQPQPEPGDDAERWNWDSPILVSPHEPKRLYFASQRVWRSDDRGDSWRPISQDLSRGQDRLKMPMMGRVWSFDSLWDLFAMSSFANVTSLSESPLQEGLIYAGTDDGLVQVTENGGESWRKIDSLPGVPDMSFVNDIKADLHDVDTVYVALDNHKTGDFAPYLLKSTDRGQTWSSIAGDPEDGGIPARHLVWRLVQDHVDPNLLFVGTEFGVFFSPNAGDRWIKLTGGVPNIPFRDLAIQQRENDLVGATFGRGFYILDDYTPLRGMNEEALEREAHLFPVKDPWWYVERRPLGRGTKATQGTDFFVAPNPPFGAVFTYYLNEGLASRKEARRKKEKEIQKEGGDNPYPGWDELRREYREEAPTIVLTVRDAAGEVVRRMTGPAKPGFHRVAWDLKSPSTGAWDPNPGFNFFGGGGFLVTPGTYSVSLAKRVEGKLSELGEPQTFVVKRLGEGTLPGADPAERGAFIKRLAELRRAVTGATSAVDATEERLGAIKEVLMRSTVGDEALDNEVRRLIDQLHDLREALQGDPQRGGIGEPLPKTILGRLAVASLGNQYSTYGPTPTHLRSVEIGEQELAKVREALNQMLTTELPALETKLEAAGVPWSPGRGVPGGF